MATVVYADATRKTTKPPTVGSSSLTTAQTAAGIARTATAQKAHTKGTTDRYTSSSIPTNAVARAIPGTARTVTGTFGTARTAAAQLAHAGIGSSTAKAAAPKAAAPKAVASTNLTATASATVGSSTTTKPATSLLTNQDQGAGSLGGVNGNMTNVGGGGGSSWWTLGILAVLAVLLLVYLRKRRKNRR